MIEYITKSMARTCLSRQKLQLSALVTQFIVYILQTQLDPDHLKCQFRNCAPKGKRMPCRTPVFFRGKPIITYLRLTATELSEAYFSISCAVDWTVHPLTLLQWQGIQLPPKQDACCNSVLVNCFSLPISKQAEKSDSHWTTSGGLLQGQVILTQTC